MSKWEDKVLLRISSKNNINIHEVLYKLYRTKFHRRGVHNHLSLFENSQVSICPYVYSNSVKDEYYYLRVICSRKDAEAFLYLLSEDFPECKEFLALAKLLHTKGVKRFDILSGD